MEWDESKHPRDEYGRFTDGSGGKYYPTNSLDPYIPSSVRKRKNNKLTRSQYARWNSIIASGLHGNYIFEQNNKKYVVIDNILIISSGTFEDPIINSVYRFKNEELVREFYNLVRKGKKNDK